MKGVRNMILFDNVDYDRFFSPLCSRNKRMYYGCILKLIEKSKLVPILYETDARDILILYLRNSSYAVEDVGDLHTVEKISSKNSETENASAILRYFRQCGWIAEREIGRSGDNIATVNSNCRMLIESIERIFNRDTSASLTNHIFAIYDILCSAFMVDHGRTHRPYINILMPVSDNVDNLKNELLILKESIRTIMRIVIKMTETNELGQFLIKDEMLNTFFNDYFFIKRDGLIPGYIAEIEKMLRELKGAEIYGNMIVEYQSINHVDESAAREVVNGLFTEIQSFISYDYMKEIDYIDNKINNYYSLYSTRMIMVLSGKVNMQTFLNKLLTLLKNFEGDERGEKIEALSFTFKLQTHKYIGRKSIERRKKRKPNTKGGALEPSTLTEDEKRRLTEELLYEHPDKYSMDKVIDYFDRLIVGKNALIPDEQIVQKREDAMMIAASIIYTGAGSFPYEVEFLQGMIETDIATISNLRIKRGKYYE